MTTTLNVDALREPMKAVHNSGINLKYEWRIEQLKTLRQMLKDNWCDWLDALKKDLGKEVTEATITELIQVEHELEMFIKNLKKWMQPEKVPTPGVVMPAFSRMERRPLCSPGCLIIGPSNYPFSLTLQPAIGCLAAGNPAVLKPSELCPNVCRVLKKHVSRYFAPGVLQVVEGGVPETTALLSKSWGLVFFTGSQRVGKIVAQAASQTLTPVVLELGGKSPCVVDETAPRDMTAVANRILWAKTLNTGQTCAAVDYAIVHESQVGKLLPEMTKSLRIQFGNDPKQSELGRIVQPQHAERLVELIKEVEALASKPGSSTVILCGGSKDCDPASGYICPTIVLNPPLSSRVMKEEIFGPILPILTVSSRQEAVQTVQTMPGTPLCLYAFTKSERVFQEICDKCPSGSAVRNDCLVHLGSPILAFGGLGSSGYGNYHGNYSFETFCTSLASCIDPVPRTRTL